MADLGDGFDATYAIAHLLAQPNLTVEKNTLPRGSAVVMGGDEVYPTSGRDDYMVKTRIRCSLARPNAGPDAARPLLLLPDNHDWYDGLVNFLAIFCRQKVDKDRKVANRPAPQLFCYQAERQLEGLVL
jgi:hypothetical protein